MLFSSFSFLLFLPLAIATLAIARIQSQQAFLIVLIPVSLVFYGWFRAEYTLILVGSAVVNFALATALDRWPDERIFAVGVFLNVALLAAGSLSVRFVEFRSLPFEFDDSRFFNQDHMNTHSAEAVWPLVAQSCFDNE